MLVLDGIRKRFGATVALDGVHLEVRPGEVHALIGENGAGKSTLMAIIAGALRPDAGSMTLNGEPYAPASPLDSRARGVALIHQELSLCPHLTVAENVLLGQEPARAGWIDREAFRREALRVLSEFGHADIDPARRVRDLPIAARQVVEICRALVARASVILMDEPTSSLQRSDVARLFTLIHELRARGLAVVYISHFLEEVRAIADRCTVLRDGQSVGTSPLTEIGDAELIARMVGRPVEDLFPHRTRGRSSDVVLEIRDVVAPPAVRRASLRVHRGEIVGIAGLVGSGRTELIRAVMGLAPAASGELEVCGRRRNLRDGTPADRIDDRIGYLSEDRKGEGVALSLSLADNVTATRYDTCARFGWLDLTRQQEQASRWLRQLRVKAQTPWQHAATLSGGNQQKIALARLLHQDAQVLLLDEPTRGVDIGSKVQLYEAIAECAAEGRGVVMVSSYLPELFGLCDSLAVMSRGTLGPVRPIEEWTPERVMEAAIGDTRRTA